MMYNSSATMMSPIRIKQTSYDKRDDIVAVLVTKIPFKHLRETLVDGIPRLFYDVNSKRAFLGRLDGYQRDVDISGVTSTILTIKEAR